MKKALFSFYIILLLLASCASTPQTGGETAEATATPTPSPTLVAATPTPDEGGSNSGAFEVIDESDAGTTTVTTSDSGSANEDGGSAEKTNTPTPPPTATFTYTPTPKPTSTPIPTSTPKPVVVTRENTPTPVPTATFTYTPTPRPTPTEKPVEIAEKKDIGELVYYDGVVDVHRDGFILDWEMIDFGLSIENYDLVTTGDDGYAEIEITAQSNEGTVVTVSGNTAFYFELENIAGSQKTDVHMLAGTIALTVKKLTKGGEVTVRTESSILGVRGTQFVVTTSPDGSVLITCSEGSVACRNLKDKNAPQLVAQPGQVVENLSEGGFAVDAVSVAELEDYTKKWFAGRLELFKSGALKAINDYSRRYNEYIGKFNTAYSNVMKNKDILQKWDTLNQTDEKYSLVDVMQEKKAITPSLLEARGVLIIFERIFYRLEELNDYHNQGYGQGALTSGGSTTDFFNTFNSEKDRIKRKAAQLRYAFKLYAKRNAGSPIGDFFSDDEDPFFETDDNFFEDMKMDNLFESKSGDFSF